MALSLDEALAPINKAKCAARGKHDFLVKRIENPKDVWYRCRVCGITRHIVLPVHRHDANLSIYGTELKPVGSEDYEPVYWMKNRITDYHQ